MCFPSCATPENNLSGDPFLWGESVNLTKTRGRMQSRTPDFAIDNRQSPFDNPPVPFLLRNLRLGLDEPQDSLLGHAARRLGVPTGAVRAYAIVRRSLDARKKDVHFEYHLEIALDEPPGREKERLRRLRDRDVVWLESAESVAPRIGGEPLADRPLIVGFGPGGMFAALRLSEYGYRPIVLERGREVRRRHRDIMQRFYRDGDFDESSNLLFGEGGAGTYSDGKLYTRIHDPLCREVLETLYHHGADPDILIDSRPHIGSDRLPTICTRIRERIASFGGEVRFESRLADLRISDNRLTHVRVVSPSAPEGEWLSAGPVILAVGHSARDTLRMLHARGVQLASKPFQIGVRIEHPQPMVDRWQYGACAGHGRLGPSEYHLVAKGAAGGRGDLFSFCMCPGGVILPTNESAGLIATNGASRSQRSSPFANSGLVISLDPRSLPASGPSDEAPSNADAAIALRALEYQEHWERIAFETTGRTYRVPCQRADDFLAGRSSDGRIETSYPLGGAWATIDALVPAAVSEALRKALPQLGAKMPGFAGPDAIVTAPETRASSPLRILRDPQTREASATANLYPVGEGAGYAGGIVSAAVDGIKTADAIIERYAPVR